MWSLWSLDEEVQENKCNLFSLKDNCIKSYDSLRDESICVIYEEQSTLEIENIWMLRSM